VWRGRWWHDIGFWTGFLLMIVALLMFRYLRFLLPMPYCD
jgi:hypothetical protein